MGLSNIQWCVYTFNAWLGCRKVAPECVNCYIVETPPFRFRGITHGGQRIRTAESTWKQPLAWNRKAAKEGTRPQVFCMSLGDWLDDENVPIEWLADLLKLIHDTPHLDWLLLTKRPQNWRNRLWSAALFVRDHHGVSQEWLNFIGDWVQHGKPPANVWIGVSAGADQAAALDIPAKVHFLSCEPMLHAMDETHAVRFDWIILGGESGKQARIVKDCWIRDALRFCRENDVACFVKQMGSNYRQATSVADSEGPRFTFKDSHGGDMDEWPEDLRVREFPHA